MNLNKLNTMWRNVTSQKNLVFNWNSSQNFVFLRKSSNTSTKDKNPKDTNKNSDSSSSSSSSGSDSDDDSSKARKKSEPATKNEETMTKLNSLLQQLIQNDTVAKKSDLKLARPKDKRVSKEERESRKVESVEKKLVRAASEVAQDIGGDTKQTESELLSKLLSPVESAAESKTLNEIVKGMKIDRETKSVEKTRADEVREILQNVQARQRQQQQQPENAPTKTRRTPRYQPREQMEIKKIDLFGAQPLGIFTNKDLKEHTKLETWEMLSERDLKLAATQPPKNYFQEMILWTEQGKLWKFPIDNEQGLEEEMKVDFSKHIFLEEHLEPWCPPKGPIRHFMELVCVGLSKNPYLTVEAKVEHIEWYKDYFNEKKKLLQQVGALPTDGGNPAQQLNK